jgi:hypothetical protein
MLSRVVAIDTVESGLSTFPETAVATFLVNWTTSCVPGILEEAAAKREPS